MAIAVTPLGTKASKTTLSFSTADGLAGSAGDIIYILCAQDESAFQPNYAFYDASSGLYYHNAITLVDVLNPSQVHVQLSVLRLPVNVATNDAIVAESTSKPTSFAFYNITGLIVEPVSTAITSTVRFGTDNSSLGLNGRNSVSRLPTCSSGTISSITLGLAKQGFPTGTVYCRIANLRDGSIIGTLGALDVSTLSDTPQEIVFNTTPVVVHDRGIALVVEFIGGDSLNYVILFLSFDSNLGGATFTTTTTWAGEIGSFNNGTSIAFKDFVGPNLGIYSNLGNSASATGTGTFASSGSTGTPTEYTLAIGIIGSEDSGDAADLKGVWTIGTNNISGNELKIGTIGGGDAGNISIYTAAKLVALGGIGNTQTAYVTGMDSIDWAAFAIQIAGKKSLVIPRKFNTSLRM